VCTGLGRRSTARFVTGHCLATPQAYAGKIAKPSVRPIKRVVRPLLVRGEHNGRRLMNCGLLAAAYRISPQMAISVQHRCGLDTQLSIHCCLRLAWPVGREPANLHGLVAGFAVSSIARQSPNNRYDSSPNFASAQQFATTRINSAGRPDDNGLSSQDSRVARPAEPFIR
jgi:hypothetical protein